MIRKKREPIFGNDHAQTISPTGVQEPKLDEIPRRSLPQWGMAVQASRPGAKAGLPHRGGHAWDFAMGTSGKTGKADRRAARKVRLAAALRENLKRRKQQARQRVMADNRVADSGAVGASSQNTEQKSEADTGRTGGAPDFRRNRNEE